MAAVRRASFPLLIAVLLSSRGGTLGHTPMPDSPPEGNPRPGDREQLTSYDKLLLTQGGWLESVPSESQGVTIVHGVLAAQYEGTELDLRRLVRVGGGGDDGSLRYQGLRDGSCVGMKGEKAAYKYELDAYKRVQLVSGIIPGIQVSGLKSCGGSGRKWNAREFCRFVWGYHRGTTAYGSLEQATTRPNSLRAGATREPVLGGKYGEDFPFMAHPLPAPPPVEPAYATAEHTTHTAGPFVCGHRVDDVVMGTSADPINYFVQHKASAARTGRFGRAQAVAAALKKACMEPKCEQQQGAPCVVGLQVNFEYPDAEGKILVPSGGTVTVGVSASCWNHLVKSELSAQSFGRGASLRADAEAGVIGPGGGNPLFSVFYAAVRAQSADGAIVTLSRGPKEWTTEWSNDAFDEAALHDLERGFSLKSTLGLAGNKNEAGYQRLSRNEDTAKSREDHADNVEPQR